MEAVIIAIIRATGSLTDIGILAAMALSVLAVYFAVTYVMWLLDKRSCESVNRALKRLQQNAGKTTLL